jgi:hypothetical protein
MTATFVADDFVIPQGFTIESFRLEEEEVIGCVHIYPARDDHTAADVHSWVRASRADLDKSLYDAVSASLVNGWFFPEIRYAPRPRTGG